MTKAIIHKYDSVFTGVGTGLPKVLHSVGVAGYNNRFVASHLTYADDAPVMTWDDAIDPTRYFTAESSGVAPLMKTVSGHKVLQFDGTDDTLVSNTLVPFGSIAILAKVLAADGVNTGLWRQVSPEFPAAVRIPGNQTGVFFPDGTTTSIINVNPNDWSVLGVQWAADPGLNWVHKTGSAVVSENVSDVPNILATSLQLAKQGGTFGSIQVAEVITWPGALSSTDFETVYTALAVHYTGLL